MNMRAKLVIKDVENSGDSGNVCVGASTVKAHNPKAGDS